MTVGQFNPANNKLSRGIAGGLYQNVRIGGFEIRKNPDTSLWYLILNRTQLIAKDLPTQDHAISLLHGVFSSKNGSTAGMNAVIQAMINDGRGVIESDGPSAITEDVTIQTTGIAGVLGALTSQQYGGDTIFEALGLVQINVATTYITFFFWTAYARDEFRDSVTYFAVDGQSMNPTTETYEEQNATTPGFGLKYSGVGVENNWITSMVSGTATFTYESSVSDAMTLFSRMDWTNKTPHVTGEVLSAVASGTITTLVSTRTSLLDYLNYPRLWFGNYAQNYGADRNNRFLEYPGGSTSSDNYAASYYWSHWNMTQSVDGSTPNYQPGLGTTNNEWPRYMNTQTGYENANKMQQTSDLDGGVTYFKFYRNYPKDNRKVIFTTDITYGQCKSVINLMGRVHCSANRIFWNGWDPDMIDLYVASDTGFENQNNRDALLRWFLDNGNPELWSGGVKITDLTPVVPPSSPRVWLNRDDTTDLLPNTTYELRW